MSKKKKSHLKPIVCPYCGRTANLRPTAYVYGDDNLDPEGYLYVCSGYPGHCDAYVGAHRKSMRPKGTLADAALRNKRIKAHRALDAIWKQGYMTRHGAYIWLQNRLNVRERDMHIGMFSDYLCGETIRECTEFMEMHQELEKGGKGIGTRTQITA
ncbi:zinc-finger-containing protein [Ruminococcus sp. 5_1_39BFAA]|uniref:zinc-finger-containing protein n=1 Tax=Ruminococcus sp. 5_1_39BFAA TaxID=457412 RepID=UPI00356786C6